MKYKTPKYPRVMVKPETHAKLAAAAKKTGKSIHQVAEGILNNSKTLK